jgi:hypothetical protein
MSLLDVELALGLGSSAKAGAPARASPSMANPAHPTIPFFPWFFIVDLVPVFGLPRGAVRASGHGVCQEPSSSIERRITLCRQRLPQSRSLSRDPQGIP